ncbi:MAG: hypothetical protein IPM59_06410 [Chloracidobacterium sp.]|nr:hypothetical protein [Chloracidobacterium sp.]
MIAGFNTDIDHNGTVYHVQTEDKGAPAYMIMSLVYDKGTILASKRTTYGELAAIGLDEKEIAERVSRQHKLMCAAVKAGRISELVEMTRKGSKYAAPAGEPVAAGEPATVSVTLSPVLQPSIPLDVPPMRPETDPFDDIPVIDAVEIIEDIEILPDEAVHVVSELSGQERPSNQKLSVELLGDAKFKGGMRQTVNLLICRGTDRKVVADAQIMVKVLGSSFRPVIFHARSDANGLAKVHLQLPSFQSGRAALLVRAMNAGEEIELRRIVTPG